MIHPATKHRVLNGWDSSYDHSSGGDEGHVAGGERADTLPFMALDLLIDRARKGNVQRLYRHDLEGFIWIIPWVFLQFEGPERVTHQLAGWETGDFADCACAKEKRDLFSKLQSSNIATASWRAEWNFAVSLLY